MRKRVGVITCYNNKRNTDQKGGLTVCLYPDFHSEGVN